MDSILAIGIAIACFLVYGFILWKTGRDFKRQMFISKELIRVKENLESGKVLDEKKWQKMKRKSKTRRVIYLIIWILIFSTSLVLFIIFDMRWYYSFLFSGILVFPAYLGYEGVIPIPGISINN